jgi:hypothetical protein
MIGIRCNAVASLESVSDKAAERTSPGRGHEERQATLIQIVGQIALRDTRFKGDEASIGVQFDLLQSGQIKDRTAILDG